MGSLDLNIVLVAGLGIQVGVDIIAQLRFWQFFLQTVFLDHDTFFFGFHGFLWALWSEKLTPLAGAPTELSDVYIADDAVSRLGVIMMKRCDDDVMHRYVIWRGCDVTMMKWFDDDVMSRYVMWPPAQISICETEGFPIWGIPSVTYIAWLNCFGSRQKLI